MATPKHTAITADIRIATVRRSHSVCRLGPTGYYRSRSHSTHNHVEVLVGERWVLVCSETRELEVLLGKGKRELRRLLATDAGRTLVREAAAAQQARADRIMTEILSARGAA